MLDGRTELIEVVHQSSYGVRQFEPQIVAIPPHALVQIFDRNRQVINQVDVARPDVPSRRRLILGMVGHSQSAWRNSKSMIWWKSNEFLV